MAAMSTALTEYANNGDSRTSTTSGHTVSKPKLVIERRRVPTGNQVVHEYQFRISQATVDADGLPIPQRVSFTGKLDFPINGETAIRDAVLAMARDIVAGDEFGNSVATGEWL